MIMTRLTRLSLDSKLPHFEVTHSYLRFLQHRSEQTPYNLLSFEVKEDLYSKHRNLAMFRVQGNHIFVMVPHGCNSQFLIELGAI